MELPAAAASWDQVVQPGLIGLGCIGGRWSHVAALVRWRKLALLVLPINFVLFCPRKMRLTKASRQRYSLEEQEAIIEGVRLTLRDNPTGPSGIHWYHSGPLWDTGTHGP